MSLDFHAHHLDHVVLTVDGKVCTPDEMETLAANKKVDKILIC